MPTQTLYSIPGFADPFSSLSHLIGAGMFGVLGVYLIRRGLHARHEDGRRAGVGHLASLIVFAAAAVLMLSMSGVYHLLTRGGTARDVLQRLDHASIFVLIAATFTPIHAILFRGPWRWGMLLFVWTLAAAGVTLKTIFFDATPQLVGLALYLAMGWVGLASIILLARRYGLRMAMPVVIGGLAYTAGAVVDGLELPPLIPGVIRGHEVFHVFVLIGLGFHWYFVWRTAELRTTARTPLQG